MAGLESINTTQYKAKQSISTTCIIQDIYTQYEGVGRGNETTNDARHHTDQCSHDQTRQQTKQHNTTTPEITHFSKEK